MYSVLVKCMFFSKRRTSIYSVRKLIYTIESTISTHHLPVVMHSQVICTDDKMIANEDPSTSTHDAYAVCVSICESVCAYGIFQHRTYANWWVVCIMNEWWCSVCVCGCVHFVHHFAWPRQNFRQTRTLLAMLPPLLQHIIIYVRGIYLWLHVWVWMMCAHQFNGVRSFISVLRLMNNLSKRSFIQYCAVYVSVKSWDFPLFWRTLLIYVYSDLGVYTHKMYAQTQLGNI